MTDKQIDELVHHGIKGQRWGVRRYQNKDGSLTLAGKKRVAKLKDEYTALTGKRLIRKPSSKGSTSEKPKTVKEMTNEELREKTNRMRLENDYVRESTNMQNLNPEKVSTGKKIVNHIWKNVVSPAATEAGKRVLTDWLIDVGKEQTKNKTIDPTKELRKEVDLLELKRRKLKAQNEIKRMSQ